MFEQAHSTGTLDSLLRGLQAPTLGVGGTSKAVERLFRAAREIGGRVIYLTRVC
ncbi:MAG TPA: hypothetical protein VGA62_05795 [Acidimicrobiia bacterium]